MCVLLYFLPQPSYICSQTYLPNLRHFTTLRSFSLTVKYPGFFLRLSLANELRNYPPPPPLCGQNFRQKKVTDLGGTPPLPLYGHFPEIFLQKGLKIMFFAQKTPDFGTKNSLRI